jgi:tetratricopeptide (TPR) repeat protein
MMQAVAKPNTRKAVRKRRPAPRKRRPIPVSVVAPAPVVVEEAFVADTSSVNNDFDQPLSTDFFNTLGRIEALPAKAESSAIAQRTIASSRGYQEEDLDVIAQMATNYLMSGGLRLAVTLFEGLVAIAPDVAYYAMGLGLTYDRMGELRKAEACYKMAGRLDTKDGRPDVNLGELALAAGDRGHALKLFARGARKANQRGDLMLARKAEALIKHLS